MDQAPAIRFEALTKTYGPVRALDAVDLTVNRGVIFGFLGPNGAGKTTAIRCLLDLIRPNGGRAMLCGLDSRRDSIEVRRRAGYLPGDLRLYEGLTGAQTIELFTSLRQGAVDAAYRRRLLDRLDLDPTKQVGSLSKGNKQKLGLVLAMMHQPEVLVLDEPTSGLDPLVQEEVALLLRDHVSAGRTVFFSSHVLSEVENLCDHVGFIRAGRMVAVEEVGALKGRSLHILEVTFAAPVPPGAFDLPGVREVERRGPVVHLEVRDAIDTALKAIARFEVVDLRTEQPSLEQVFLAYYHDNQPEVPSAT
ncbi:MAG TPA: ABC transporter ATP-binding protein [Dehalococcoidia bacterium]|nr:ABC transporter ATP-binding protein [Dehalococcoidia bacterium]